MSFFSCKNSDEHNNNETIAATQEELSEISLDSIKGAYLSIDSKRYDFGIINREKVPHISIKFNVVNNGKVPLIILKADVSCSCVSVKYSDKPINPGDKTELIINVDTRKQEGVFNKKVFLKSNAENDIVLIHIMGEIKK